MTPSPQNGAARVTIRSGVWLLTTAPGLDASAAAKWYSGSSSVQIIPWAPSHCHSLVQVPVAVPLTKLTEAGGVATGSSPAASRSSTVKTTDSPSQ